jgi:Domain of unknown function (DUF4124)
MQVDHPMKLLSIFLTLACSAFVSPANAEIYKYVDENGQVTFTDMPRRGVRANHVYNMPAGPTNLGISRSKSSSRKSVSYRPDDFPRIDPETQRKRDDIRRQVLEEELTSERQGLAEAQRQLSIGSRVMSGERISDATYLSRVKKLEETVGLHQSNILAIKKELGTAR